MDNMSLKKNIISNYASQAYVTLIGITVVPLYIKYMGAEAYGLVGVFILLQTLFNMLDMGLSPTVARETARLSGGGTDPLTYRQFVRALELIFLVVAILDSVTLIALSSNIASDWLKLERLSHEQIEDSLKIISLAVSFRWMSVLYRGVITGAERLVWLSATNSIIATVRFILVIPILVASNGNVLIFFIYQLVISIFELVILVYYSYLIIPRINRGDKINWQWGVLKNKVGFSLTIAFTSTVWVLVTQTDKLVLSKILSLSDYGYFTLGVLVASAVLTVSGPISTAILPRLVRLEAQNNQTALLSLYRDSTQLVAVIAGASSISIAYCANTLLMAWTGDPHISEMSSQILALYAMGNGFLCIAAFPYYLQYAKGDLRLHLYFNVIFVLVLVPTIAWAANKYGAAGAGWVWLGMNGLPLLIWVPVVHKKFAPELNIKWFFHDVLPVILPMAICGYFINQVLPPVQERFQQMLLCVFFGIVLLITGALSSSVFRRRMTVMIRT